MHSNSAISSTKSIFEKIPKKFRYIRPEAVIYAFLRINGCYICFLVRSVSGFNLFNLCWRKHSSPHYSIIPDQVMRATCEAPVPDRGAERDRSSFFMNGPINRRKGRYYLLAATATALMECCCIALADIKHSLLQLVGDYVDK